MDIEKIIEKRKRDPKFIRHLREKIFKKRVHLHLLNSQYETMIQLQGESEKSEDFKNKILKKNQEIENMPTEIDEIFREELEDIKKYGDMQGFNVSLIDGSSFEIHHVELSDNYDLALFQLDDTNCPYLQLNEDYDIQQGTQLYSIGHPSGLLYTVTSGILSGYQYIKGKRFILTDVPINPGNSGGPLVTVDGKLVGINTFGIRGIEGIGGAIPAFAIEETFGDIIYFN